MKSILGALLALFLFTGTVLAAPQTTHIASLTLDQTNPVYGQSITLTGVYGKVYSGRQPQLPNQPQVQINCSTPDGTQSWQENQDTSNKVSLGQGWNQSVYPFVLGAGYGSNNNNWASGAASCSAILFYFDSNFTLYELAFANFDVGP